MKVQFQNKAISTLTQMRSCLSEFLSDERGQSTTEYILILSVVVMIAMKFKTTFQSKLISTVNQLGGDIDQVVTSTDAGN